MRLLPYGFWSLRRADGSGLRERAAASVLRRGRKMALQEADNEWRGRFQRAAPKLLARNSELPPSF